MCSALIKVDGIPGNNVYSKFKLEGRWENSQTGVYERWVFNINSDVALPAFHSPGADKNPPQWNLTGIWQVNTQFTGFDRFSGSIGEGRIYIHTDKGLVFKGAIIGGPDEGSSFVGAGTWIKSWCGWCSGFVGNSEIGQASSKWDWYFVQ